VWFFALPLGQQASFGLTDGVKEKGAKWANSGRGFSTNVRE
jgi:hypothetical protein